MTMDCFSEKQKKVKYALFSVLHGQNFADIWTWHSHAEHQNDEHQLVYTVASVPATCQLLVVEGTIKVIAVE